MLTLLSNDLERSAGQIAALYKQRWQIELLFGWIKQHLKIRKFLGSSENAVRIQIAVALIALLVFAALWLISPLMLRSKRSGSWSRAR